MVFVPDLIDTLWNVKALGAAAALAGLSRFNRYIVECKDKISCRIHFAAVDLIDTLWNVKNRFKNRKQFSRC